jgi:hypothetical protein
MEHLDNFNNTPIDLLLAVDGGNLGVGIVKKFSGPHRTAKRAVVRFGGQKLLDRATLTDALTHVVVVE